MSDHTLELTLNLHCLVEIVSAIGGGILDEAAALSAYELQERIEFLRREVEHRLDAMGPPAPPPPGPNHNRIHPDDLPF